MLNVLSMSCKNVCPLTNTVSLKMSGYHAVVHQILAHRHMRMNAKHQTVTNTRNPDIVLKIQSVRISKFLMGQIQEPMKRSS